jgi:PDZ domain-containing protein
VALFADDGYVPGRSRRSGRIGAWLIGAAVFGTFLLGLVPAPYVIEQPGPVYDTLGDVSIGGEETPMIEIPDQETYPTDGSLSLLTVRTHGSPDALPNWFEVVTSWFDPSRAVKPVNEVYPPGFSVEDSNQSGRIQMENSQKNAVAAALTYLGHELPSRIVVAGFSDDSPSENILENGDQITMVEGKPVSDVDALRDVIADVGSGNPLELTIVRDSQAQEVTVTPEPSPDDEKTPVIGVFLSIDYDFPFDVDIQLENVGGPSGGQMFALGIIDKLTPGKLTGGEEIAGTGTIDADGDVGQIGGIRQKMYGAENAGANWFLAPVENCDEVVGHVPDGLTVVAVDTLEDSIAAVEAIASGDTAALPSCS